MKEIKDSALNRRSVSFSVYLPLPENYSAADKTARDERCRRIRDALNFYRHVCKNLFAVGMVCEEAGAEFSYDEKRDVWKVIPGGGGESAAKILGALYKEGKAHWHGLYYAAKELAPNWRAETWSYAQRQVSAAWRAKDPKFAPARRSYLILNGARRLAEFQFLPLPIHPKRLKFAGHSMTVEWDREIGPVCFRLGEIDGGRWHWFKGLLEGKFHVGAAYLSDDGKGWKIRVVFDYPVEAAAAKNDGVLEVNFDETDPAKYLQLSIRGGETETERRVRINFSAVAAVAEMDRLKMQLAAREAEREACGRGGDCRRGEGHGKARAAAAERIHRLAVRRANAARTWNHVWSGRIVREAERWRCGSIAVYDLPENSKEKDEGGKERLTGGLCRRPWPFAEFKKFVEYKAKAAGMAAVWPKSPLAATIAREVCDERRIGSAAGGV